MKKNYFSLKHLKGSVAAGTIYLIAILIMVIMLSAVLSDGAVPPNNTPDGDPVTPVMPAPDKEKSNLQLYTFGYTTPAPTTTTPPVYQPGGICRPDTGGSQRTCVCMQSESDLVFCKEDPCSGDHDPFADSIIGRLDGPPFNVPVDYTCSYSEKSPLHNQKKREPQCVQVCLGKPVIYLYPLTPTLVDVILGTPGIIYISDPMYPKNGWKNVLAYPNGSLIYQNKTYHELYYESRVDKVKTPDSGIVIPTADLKEKLNDITASLGLKENERKEFLEYWLPKLDKLNSPYIFFSLLDDQEKERVDHVDITPAPDTFIEFIAYFKPLNSNTKTIKPLSLPPSPPERIGFTAVEWGGTIDY